MSEPFTLPVYDSKKVEISKSEEQKLIQDARKDARDTTAGMVVGGGLSHLAGRAGLKHAEGGLKDLMDRGYRLSDHDFNGKITDASRSRVNRYGAEIMPKKFALTNAKSLISAGLKGGGKALGLTGLAYGGIQEISRALDKGDQGILSDEVIKGDKQNYLIGGGVTAAALGFAGKTHLANKIQKTVLKKSPMEIAKEQIKYDIKASKIRDKHTGTYSELRAKLNKLNQPDFSPEKVLTPDAKRVKELQESIRGLKLGQIEEQLELENEIASISKRMKDKSSVKKRDFKNQAVFEGIQNIGGLAASTGALNSSDYGSFNSKKRELEAKKELSKTSMDPFSTAAAGHMLQNGLFNYFTKTNRGRKSAGKFVSDRFTEGYTGKSVKDGFSDKFTRIEAKINPLNLFRSKKEAVRAARSGGDRVSGYKTGVGYHLMPEAETMARELRHAGASIRDGGVDLKETLSKADLRALEQVADGDLHGGMSHLATSPTAAHMVQVMFPSMNSLKINSLGTGIKRGLEKIDPKKARKSDDTFGAITSLDPKKILDTEKKVTVNRSRANAANVNEEWMDTGIQKIMKSTKDHIKSKGGLSAVSREPIENRVKNEKIGYNISHAAMAPYEYGAAGLNGIKRVAAMEKMHIKDTDHGAVKTAKKIANTTKTGLDAMFVKLPSIQAKAKGLSGIRYSNTSWSKANEYFGSPALKMQSEDTQRISRIIHAASKDGVRSKSVNGKPVGDNILHQKAMNIGEEAKKRADRYGSGIISGPYRLAKDILSAGNSAVSGDGVATAKATMKAMSKNENTREQGERELKEIGKKVKKKAEKETRKHTDKMEKAVHKGQDEAQELQNRYEKWALPGTAVGGAALASPMIKDIYDRNTEESKKASALINNKKEKMAS